MYVRQSRTHFGGALEPSVPQPDYAKSSFSLAATISLFTPSWSDEAKI